MCQSVWCNTGNDIKQAMMSQIEPLLIGPLFIWHCLFSDNIS